MKQLAERAQLIYDQRNRRLLRKPTIKLLEQISTASVDDHPLTILCLVLSEAFPSPTQAKMVYDMTLLLIDETLDEMTSQIKMMMNNQ